MTPPTSLLQAPHQRPAPTDAPLHELLRLRWSPRAFASDLLTLQEQQQLFEAARWAPSAYNEQPWAFVVATRDDPAAFQRLLACLHPYNQLWAGRAALLAITAARRGFSNKPEANRSALYDLGQAVAHLSFQATALGLAVHQMVGMDADQARAVCAIPAGYEVASALAIGRPGDPALLTEAHQQREAAPRQRVPAATFVHAARWGAVPEAELSPLPPAL